MSLSELDAKVLTYVTIAVVLVSLALEVSTPDVVFVIALTVIWCAGVISLDDAVSGFSNDAVVTIGALFLVVIAVERSHILDYFARKAFGVSSSTKVGIARALLTCFFLSAFLNNTPLVALMLPIVRDWARVREIAPSQVLMSLSFSVLSGGLLTMIGTSTSLLVQGILKRETDIEFGFFDPGKVCLPLGLLSVAYMVFAGPYLLPHDKTGLLRHARDHANELIAEIEVTENCPLVGKQIAPKLAKLGIPPSTIIKIRRRIEESEDKSANRGASVEMVVYHSSIEVDLSGELAQDTNQPIDPDHVKNVSKCWGGQSSKSGVNDSSNIQYFDILNPNQFEVFRVGDIIFVACARDVVEKLYKAAESDLGIAGSIIKSVTGGSNSSSSSSKFRVGMGLRILNSNVFDLAGFGSELLEVVLSSSNPFIGRVFGVAVSEISSHYACGIVSVRHRNQYNAENLQVARERAYSNVDDDDDEKKKKKKKTDNDDDVNNYNDLGTLFPGDTLLIIASCADVDELTHNPDFFVVTKVGNMPDSTIASDAKSFLDASSDYKVLLRLIAFKLYKVFPVIVFIVMIVLVATETVPIIQASMAAASLLFLGGWLKSNDFIPTSQSSSTCVDWKLLVVIGCSIGFASAVENSGIAQDIGSLIGRGTSGPQSSLFLVYAITLVMTSVVTNNAAAAIMLPIALSIADEFSCNYEPFAMAVLIGATSCYSSPIGYQTHLMVWAPGGYKFTDFVKFGFLIDMLMWVGACLLIPLFWPFH